MAIPLKSLIEERIQYFAPNVEIFKQTAEGQNPANYQKAKTLFYDFYAMESLHRQLGHNPYLDDADPIKKSIAAQHRGVSWYDPSGDDNVVFPDSGHVVNHKFKEVIEDVFAQVTKAISDKMMVHLRLGLIQELRHLLEKSSWDTFYRSVGNAYHHNNGKLTISQFQKVVEDNIPGMSKELDSVVRLLKFTKAYKQSTGNNTPADIAAKALKTDDEYEDPGPLTGHEEGVPIKMPGEDAPDPTEYGVDAIEDSPYWEEEPAPTKPPTRDPSGYVQHGDYWNPNPGSAVYSPDEKDEEDAYGNKKGKKFAFFHKKDKSKLTEANLKFSGARMSPELLKSIRQAINKSGLKWEDVDNAYNKIEWSGGWGGKMWGTGTKSYLKLVTRANDMDSHEMALVVDHIFDLMHNTGGLLNKGGMNIEDEDLDRRAKCTHIARYIPLVSPLIKRIILLFLKYYPGNPEEQKNIDAITSSPHSINKFTPEQQKVLTDFGFYSVGNRYKANIIFFSKKVDKYGNRVQIHGRYYEAKAHDNGKFSIADGLKSDIQIFNTFEELQTYIDTAIKNDISKAHLPTPPPPPPVQSEKDVYITSHTRIRLPSDKEAQLLTVNVGWRPKSNYYKAYFTGGKRFYLYAFDDGSFLTTYGNTVVFKTFLDWNAAFIHITGETKEAEDYTKHSTLAPATPSAADIPPATPSSTGDTSKLGGLTQAEYNQLSSNVNVGGLNVGVAQSGGAVPVMTPSTKKIVFYVFKEYTQSYSVWHFNNGTNIGKWNFTTFNEMMAFINQHFVELSTGLIIPKDTAVKPGVGLTATGEMVGGGLGVEEYGSISNIVSQNGLQAGKSSPGGPVPVTIAGTNKRVFSVGYINNIYNVWQTNYNGIGIGNWNFHTFNEMKDFISKHIYELKMSVTLSSDWTAKSPSVASLSTTNIQLPPNAGSSAAYSMHSGLDVPPKTSIRLTTIDEGELNGIGFTPKMIGKDVYYIHTQSGDAVKFYPNNMATLSFYKGTAVKFDIPKMLTWLKQKYTATSVSPLKSPHAPAKGYTMGIQAGPMYEAKIISAGFSWQPQNGRYVDNKFNGKNTIFIKPNRSSTVTIVDSLTNTPEEHYFANLPALASYLATQYPQEAQKKTEPLTSPEPTPVASPVHEPPPAATEDHALVFPSWVPQEVRRVMQVNNFQYGGSIDIQSYRYLEEGHENSNVLYINPDQTFTVYDENFLGYANSPKKFSSVSDVMVNYFNKKYGKPASQNPSVETPPPEKHTYIQGEPITIKPSWVPPKAFQLMEKGKYNYGGPVTGHSTSYRYTNDKGDVIYMHPGNKYEVFDKNTSLGESEKYSVDGFIEYLQETYGSLPGGEDTNEDIASQMDSTLTNLGLIEPNGSISIHNKIAAIKYIREFYYKKTGKSGGLKNTKECVENYSWFFAYVKENGLPPMESSDNTLEILTDFSKTIGKSSREPSGHTYKTQESEANAKLIRLNKHDEKLLELCGFKWTPKENAYYKDAAGRIAKFRNTGRADLIDSNVETTEFELIPELLKYIVTHYGPNSSLNQGSGSTMQKDVNTERLEKLGFSKINDYVYTKKVTDPSHGDIFHKVTLNPVDDSMKYQILMKSDMGGFEPMQEDEFVSISAGLDTLEEWMGVDKKESPPTKVPMPFGGTNYVKDPNSKKSMKLDLNEELILKKLGFIYKSGNVMGNSDRWYENNTGEQVTFRENGTGGYWTEGKKYTPFPTVKALLQFLWDNYGPIPTSDDIAKGKYSAPKTSTTPKGTGEMPFSGYDYSQLWKTQSIPQKSTIRLVSDDEDTLKQIGFTYTLDGTSKAYRKGLEEVIFYADGTARYYSDYNKAHYASSFESVKDAMKYLWDKESIFIEEKISYKSMMRAMLE